MSCTKIRITSDAFRTLIYHALSTDQEEILGLLCGNFEEEAEGTVVNIWASINLLRSTKEPDRCEIDEIQLSSAISEAEGITKSFRKATRLVGWYHSHPKITVFPSHVDVNTQKNLQSMGDHFVGLILACFQFDAVKQSDKVELIGFQSMRDEYGQPLAKSIPVSIKNTYQMFGQLKLEKRDYFDNVYQIQKNLLEEDHEAYAKAQDVSRNDELTLIRNSTIHTESLLRILEYISTPTLECYRCLLSSNERLSKDLDREIKSLQKEVAALKKEKTRR